ncbi:MAG: zinc ribbon domain-containing protein [Clostridia bacterium]|nr:zinc ribbon domain-containing protein [Clostridia bacterium]
MIECKKCGYENSDGSRICLNCREILEEEKTVSDSVCIKTNQTFVAEEDKQEKQQRKNTLIIVVSLIAVFIFAVIVYVASLNKSVVDEQLLGSWQSSGYGYSDIWTFEKDGTYSMKRSGTGIFSEGLDVEGFYSAENGRLKISWSKNIDDYILATYEYMFGTTGNGTQCLILEKNDIASGTSTEVLLRVD